MLDTTETGVEAIGTATSDQSWRKRSSCASVDPEIFFGEDEVSRAKQICAGCPVRDQCREWADAAGEFLGVWGGHTGLERGWGSDGGRIDTEADRVIFVCACCDAALSWPMSASPTTASVGKGSWQLHLQDGKAQFLIARSDGRDLRRGGPLHCRNGHDVGFSTGFSGLIAFDNDAVLQVPMSQRRQHRSVA